MTLKVISQGHSPFAGFSSAIRRTFAQHFTRFQLTARSRGSSATAGLLVIEWIRCYFWILYDMNGKNSVKLDMITTSQHYVMNVMLRWTVDWQISHAYFVLFQRFVSHVRSADTNPKQNVLGLFCVCFGFILELFWNCFALFCFSCKSCLRASETKHCFGFVLELFYVILFQM